MDKWSERARLGWTLMGMLYFLSVLSINRKNPDIFGGNDGPGRHG